MDGRGEAEDDGVIREVRALQRKLEELAEALGMNERFGGDAPDGIDQVVRSISNFA